MTSSHDWDSGPTEPTPHGQHSGTPDPLGSDPWESDPLSGGHDASSTTGGSSGSGDAKERAQQAAGTAKEEGAHVAETAKDEAQQVVGEAKEKAADLLSDARSQLDQQSRTQLQALADKLEQLSGEVDSMVEGSDVQGQITELARQLSDKTRALSSHLSSREPSDLLEDVRGFARQRPGTFLLGAAAAGILAGRLTRGAKKAHDADSGSGTGSSSAGASGSPATGSAGGSMSGSTGLAGTGAPTANDYTSSAVGGLGGTQSTPAGQNTGGRL